MGLESLDDDALDAETVLWAVRGMQAAQPAVSADDVARFLAKDTTLSVQYDRDDVEVVLDTLTTDGTLNFEPTTGEWSLDEILPATEKRASALPDGTANEFLRLQLEVLERERDEVGAERDEWRRRAEAAARDASWERRVGDELRARVRELERLLDQERAAGQELSETTKRAAAALAAAQQELDQHEPARRSNHPSSSRHKRTLRGNWLE